MPAAKPKAKPKPKGRRSAVSAKPRAKRSRKGVGGRPKIVWAEQQWQTFASMCILTDKRHRVAVAMGYDEKTIDRLVKERHGSSFSEYIEKRFTEGNFQLLATQFEAAKSGDRTMLVWLGKNRLNQSERCEIKADLQGELEIEHKGSVTLEEARAKLRKKVAKDGK